MQKETLKDLLVEELDTNTLIDMVRNINSWDGSFEDLDYWDNDDEFFETFYSGRMLELVRALSFGSYNYMDSYVKINTYGNIVSANTWEFEEEVEGQREEIIERYLELMESRPQYFERLWDEELEEEDEESEEE